jgi:hypothetical protein
MYMYINMEIDMEMGIDMEMNTRTHGYKETWKHVDTETW